MTEAAEPPLGDLTLCLVIHDRHGNLANVLQSVNRLASDMVVVDAGGGSGQSVKHLTSEYDAKYLLSPADPDESALLNKALREVDTTWALFLNQQEVLHTNDDHAFLANLDDPDALAYDLPIMHLSEPNNYHFETRLIRADAGIRWQHGVYPTLGESIEQVAERKALESPVGLIPIAVVVSLGDPHPEEWELRDTLVRVERELDRNP